MTPEQIQQDNELIAVFDGWEVIPGNEDHKCFSCDEGKGPSMFCTCDQKKTRYRKESTTNDRPPYYNLRWEVLMPVVEKISTIKLDQYENCQDTHWPRTFGMPSTDGGVMVRFNCAPVFTKPTLIEAAHAAVCDFIKWYNEQNK